MIYTKTLKVKKQKTKQITINDFAKLLPQAENSESAKLSKATKVFNFVTKHGGLLQGAGLNALAIPRSEDDSEATLLPEYTYNTCGYEGVWLYRYFSQTKQRDDFLLLLYADDGAMYFVRLFDNDSNVYRLYDLTFSSKPIVINHRMYERNYVLICSETDGMTIWDGVTIPQKVAGAPNIRSACLHGSRLFALTAEDRYAVRFSKELDPTNWLVSSGADSSGFIRFSDQLGKANKIVSFLGYIFVFREYGISKITFYEEDSTYNISQIFFASGRIYEGTIAAAEKEIFFMTRDGIYSFDGVSFEKQNLTITELFDSDNREGACGVFFGGRYHLACKLDYKDNSYFGDETDALEYVNNTILTYDPKDKTYSIIRGVDASFMLALDVGRISKLAITTRGENKNYVSELNASGSYYTKPLLKVWKTSGYSFGDMSKVKLIKSLCIKSKYNITIKIKTDLTENSFDIKGADFPQTIMVNLKGKIISFEIISYEEKADVSAFSLEVVYDG